MADLGDIVVRASQYDQVLWGFPTPTKAIGAYWNRPDTTEPEVHSLYQMQFPNKTAPKALSGTVAGNQSDFTQCIVRVYRRLSGKLIGEVRPKANGAFSVEVDGDAKEYYVIALDPVGGEEFNALIFDRITTA